jgi:hypothetical protein
MAARPSFSRIRLIVMAAIVVTILAVNLWFIVPGLLAGKPLVGTPNSNPIYSTGGFHCPGDGPNRIHYHTCYGPPVALPSGTKPSDFPDHD